MVKMIVYKFKCIDCDVIFYVEDQGQLDHANGSCPVCESDSKVERWEGSFTIYQEVEDKNK